MKKIIATVLAMVMALALCTTAFAAPKTYIADDVGSATVTEPADGHTFTLEKFATGTASAKVFDTYKLWDTTTATGAKAQVAGTGEYFLATSASYDKVFVNGSTITYLLTKTTAGTWDDTAKFVNVAKADSVAKAACGTYYSLTAATTVIEYKDEAYYGVDSTSSNITVLNIDGKAAFIDTTAKAANDTTNAIGYKSHSYVVDTALAGGKLSVTKVSCDDCKASFEFVVGSATDATVKFGAGNFEAVKTGNPATVYTVNGDTLFVKTGSGTPDSGKNTTTSPKTFDAGIAMYVGMALTSVAGSAVVIGKKKEF